MDVGERTRLGVRVLGDLAAAGPGARPIGGPTLRRAFALLVVHRNETTTIDQLVDACWPDGEAPTRAEHNVRTYVHRLRTALGEHDDRIETAANGYRIRLDAAETDVDRFEQLAAEAGRLVDAADPASAIDRLDEAESLWRGRPYAEFADEPWAEAEVARLDEVHRTIGERRADALLAGGRPAEAVGLLERLVRDEPFREGPRALLMRALYESARQAEALRAFQEFRRLLIDDAGIEPSTDLVDLDRRIASGTLGASTTGRKVGNYELHERIGEGAFAVVHRATQASLGREVAVKIVRAELANQSEFIRRFEAEAQMVASIEHPNVVPLFDYWREPGNAYLVMRWMTGGSLEQRLDRGPLVLDAVVRLVDEVAAALDAAHAHDIVHRDVKPANILFDDGGRALLSDFGIALAAEERSTPQAALSEGSPVFASPEQLRREPAGPEADVHALGIVAFTALAGRTPFHDCDDDAELLHRQLADPVPAISSVQPGLPTGLDDVIATATAKRPDVRYPTALGFAAAFRAAAEGGTTASMPTLAGRANPYLGLRTFTEADVAFFHGRARVVDELLGACAVPERRLVTVVGPSGSGKSSVVGAGLVPALRSGRIAGSADWFVTTMVPGARPFEALEVALMRIAANPPPTLLEQLNDGDRGIHRGVSRIIPDDTDTVLLVIDQFEELFTLTAGPERQRFLRALTTAVTEPGGPLRVAATLRADFFDEPLRHPGFAQVFKTSVVAITPLAPDELEEAITAPAADVGVGFEPGLVAEIVADVNSQPGALPLLQYALTQAFDVADGDTVEIADYREVGGLAGALARTAEALHAELADDERPALRRLVGRLVTLGEGVEDTRRRVRRSELPADPATDRVIEQFGDARLLTFDRDPATREPTVEIAHEALLREWPRVRTWLDEDRDGLRIQRHLTTASRAWIGADRDEGELYRGGRLETATTWAAAHEPSLNAEERDFLDAGRRLHDAEVTAERQNLDAQRRSNRRLRVLAGIATVVALVAALVGVFALQQRSRANEQAARSDLERLILRARNASSVDPTVDLLLAVEAHRLAPSFETLDALHWALTARPGFAGSLDTGRIGDDITALDDGRRLVVHTLEEVQLWDAADRRLLASWPTPAGATTASEIRTTASPDGALVVVAGPDDTVVRDMVTGDVLERFGHDAAPTAVALSPDGMRLALGFGDGSITIHPLGDGSDAIVRPATFSSINDLAWLPSGDRVVIATDRNVAALRMADLAPEWQRSGSATSVIVSADGRRVVAPMAIANNGTGANAEFFVRRGRTVTVLEAGTGRIEQQVPDVDATHLDWSDEEQVEVVGTRFDDPLTRIDLLGERVLPGPGVASGRSEGIGVLTDLGAVAVAGTSSVELLALDGSGPLSRTVPLAPELDGETELFRTGAFDDSGTTLVTAAFPIQGSIRSYDLGAATLSAATVDIDTELDPIAIQRFGDYVLEATGAPVGLIVRSDVLGPVVSREIGFVGGFFFALSPRGDLFATEQGGEEIVVLDVATGDQRYRLGGVTSPEFSVPIPEFSPDGRYLHVWNGGNAHRFDAETGTEIWSTERWGYVYPGPDDEWVATAEPDGSIDLREPDTLQPIGRRLVGHRGVVTQFYFEPESRRAVTAADDGVARVWDTDEGRQLGRELPAVTRSLRFFAPGGDLLAVPGPDGYTVWNFDTDTWADIACEVAGRNLTSDEWDDAGPRNVDHRPTCPQYPLEP